MQRCPPSILCMARHLSFPEKREKKHGGLAVGGPARFRPHVGQSRRCDLEDDDLRRHAVATAIGGNAAGTSVLARGGKSMTARRPPGLSEAATLRRTSIGWVK